MVQHAYDRQVASQLHHSEPTWWSTLVRWYARLLDSYLVAWWSRCHRNGPFPFLDVQPTEQHPGGYSRWYHHEIRPGVQGNKRSESGSVAVAEAFCDWDGNTTLLREMDLRELGWGQLERIHIGQDERVETGRMQTIQCADLTASSLHQGRRRWERADVHVPIHRYQGEQWLPLQTKAALSHWQDC